MALTRAIVEKEVQKAQSRQQMGNVRFLKANTTTHLRVLEFTDDKGNTLFSREVVEWIDNGRKGKNIVNRRAMFGATDAVEDMDRKASGGGESLSIRERHTYYINAIDIDEKKPEVKIWQLPTTVWQIIVDMAMSDEWADVLETTKGHAFEIKKSGKGLDTTYSCSPMRNPWPVSASLSSQIIDPLSEVIDPGLNAQLDYLGINMDDLYPSVPEDVEPVRLAVGSRTSKPSPVSKSVVEPTNKTNGKGFKFGVGDKVFSDEFGEDFPGTIESVSPDGGPRSVLVVFDDGDRGNYGPENLTMIEAATPAKAGLSVNDLVSVDFDETPYKGKVASVNTDGTFHIVFDDGDEGDYSEEEIELDIPFDQDGEKNAVPPSKSSNPVADLINRARNKK